MSKIVENRHLEQSVTCKPQYEDKNEKLNFSITRSNAELLLVILWTYMALQCPIGQQVAWKRGASMVVAFLSHPIVTILINNCISL